MTSTYETIEAFVVSELLKGDAVELRSDTDLIETEIVDSLGVFTLVCFLEDDFDVTIEPDDIVIENFTTLAAIEGLLRSKLP